MDTPQQKWAKTHRSHLLIVLSNAAQEKKTEFRKWLKDNGLKGLFFGNQVLCVRSYAMHPVKVNPHSPPLGFDFLTLFELCIDGTKEAGELISKIRSGFEDLSLAGKIATGLYYPVGEKTGCPGKGDARHITIAFSNPSPGCDHEFREWYTTQHIRHALVIPALLNGQVFEATRFQEGNAMAHDYQTIAIYDMGTTPEALMESIPNIDVSQMAWSKLGDFHRFTECFYERL